MKHYQIFSLEKGSNQYVHRVKITERPVPVKGYLLVFLLFTVIIPLGLFVLISDMVRLYIQPFIHYSEQTIPREMTSFIDTLQIQTANSDFYRPITQSYAQELLHQKEPEPEQTAKELIYSQKHGDIIWRIYGLESSFGANDGCLAKGLYNGFGYRQNTKEWVCYPTFKEVVLHVEHRLEELETLPLGQQLCLYNQGIKQKACGYTDNFIKL